MLGSSLSEAAIKCHSRSIGKHSKAASTAVVVLDVVADDDADEVAVEDCDVLAVLDRVVVSDIDTVEVALVVCELVPDEEAVVDAELEALEVPLELAELVAVVVTESV